MSGRKELTNQILCGDCIQIMQSLPDACMDLIVTSPPYNLKNSTGNGTKQPSGLWKRGTWFAGDDQHDDSMPHDEYVNWQRHCLTEMFRLLKENGAIFYNHKWRVQGGLFQDRAEIVQGFPVRQIIIWHRSGGINFNRGYFLPTYEVVYLICKPRFRLLPKASGFGDVWRIPQERNNPHPAPFPLTLAEKIISATSAKLIFDPFLGSGTTALAARNLGRNYLGIEISLRYCRMASERLIQHPSILKTNNSKKGTV